jgi:hypothetical protein
MIKSKKTILIISIAASLFFYSSQNFCQSIAFHSKPLGYHVVGQMTFDIYKPYASIYFNMKRLQKPVALQKGEEKEIYLRLGRRLLFPTYLLFQITGYPLSALSSYLETDRYDTYNRFTVYSDLNMLRSIGVGFEEPYAFSIFLGNVLFLAYQDSAANRLKQSGSALAGFLISTGKHQIYNNIYLHDSWYQIELMLVGNLNEPKRRKILWNFRIGAKFHQNEFLRDMFTLSIERSHTNWRSTGWSLVKNSIFKYQAHLPIPSSDDSTPGASHLITYGKKFPINLFHRKVFFVLGIGMRWEWVRFYDHNLDQFDPDPKSQLIWLIQPNLEF